VSFLKWIGLIIFGAAAVAQPAQLVIEALHIAWPEHWELREPVRQGAVLRLQAREQNQGATLQLLDLTAVNTASASTVVDQDSIHELAAKLRDAALKSAVESKIELVPFTPVQGYYFVATDHRPASPDNDRQMVEGVMLHSGYLINFTSLTNDATSAETRKMIAALAELRID
jgi:hypothetical protein